MMSRLRSSIIIGLASLLNLGCNSDDIPQAHKGQMFDRTGALALYAGGDGLSGPVLGPGTHFTGLYDELRIVDCNDKTIKETMPSLTKDGVQFNTDVYVLFTPNCEDDSVKKILAKLSPESGENDEPANTINANQLWGLYIRPPLGKIVRGVIKNYNANDVNPNREQIESALENDFLKKLNTGDSFVIIKEFNVSNLGFPKDLIKVNTERAKEQMLRDKAIAARERVTAEQETERKKIEEQTLNAEKKLALKEKEGTAEAKRLDLIGAAYGRNPELAKLHGIEAAAAKGNLILLDGKSSVLVQSK